MWKRKKLCSNVALLHRLAARSERDARGVDDREVVSQHGVQTYEPVVEHLDRVARTCHGPKPNGQVNGPQSAVLPLGCWLPPVGSLVTHSQR